MPNTPETNSYQLSKIENEIVFKQKILPELKEDFDFTSKDKPTAYFTAGLPGAGKSRVLQEWEKTKPNIIIIDADELRKEHPKTNEILSKYGAEASAITHLDAVKWVSQLKQEAFNNKADYILDSSMRNPKSAEIEVGQALKNGYSVEVTMVAVNKYESLQGIYDRYANQYESNAKEARFVDPKLIENANISIRDSAAVLDNLDVKQFKIVDRNMDVVFDSTKDIKGTAKEKLEQHTNLQNWSTEKLNTLKQNFDKVVNKLEEIKAPKLIIDSAKSQQSNLNTEIKTILSKEQNTLYTIRQAKIVEIPKDQLKHNETSFPSRKEAITYQVATNNVHNFNSQDKQVLSENFNEISSKAYKNYPSEVKESKTHTLKEILIPSKQKHNGVKHHPSQSSSNEEKKMIEKVKAFCTNRDKKQKTQTMKKAKGFER